jgi:hypothetical protein
MTLNLLQATGGGYFGNSGILYLVAKKAYERTTSAPSDTAFDQDEALVAILFSAATLEAFINEFDLFANISSNLLYPHAMLRFLAQVLSEIETSRGSVRLKYLLAKSVLSGVPYEKGKKPYQDFDLLFRIRDEIVHMRPDKIKREPHKIIAALSARGLCAKDDPHVKSTWLSQIKTRAVARWACNVVRDMVASIKDSLPENENNKINPLFLLLFHSSQFEGVD